jgi:homoserine dehydrogenase
VRAAGKPIVLPDGQESRMATPVPVDTVPEVQPGPSSQPLAVALLGAGVVGSAVARRLTAAGAAQARLVSALVRDAGKRRETAFPPGILTSDPSVLFATKPDVVVELLGGIEPAFTLVSRALSLGIPVVTANKSLLAARGGELERRAAAAGVPLLYEASVLAGVPFLGALADRPRAAHVSRIAGILNGTSNAVLQAVAAGTPFALALADAQRRGLAEPNPEHDVRGIDAAEKLAVVLRLVGWGQVDPRAIETSAIDVVSPVDLHAAAAFDGVVKPIVLASRGADGIAAFSGPAFLPRAHRLARVDGTDNAIVLTTPHGDVVHAGPGAGPDATADTVLDDVAEAASRRARTPRPVGVVPVTGPRTSWFIRLTAPGALPAPEEIADFLGAHGIWMRRTSAGKAAACHLTWPCSRERLARALAALGHAAGTESVSLRAVEE